METFFYQVKKINKYDPAIAYDINLEGICTGDGINRNTISKMAEYHAKFLSSMTGCPVRFYPKGRIDSAKEVDVLEDNTGGSEIREAQKV